jgi:hypothetical protein
MSTEQKETDQNALAAKLGRTWDNFKQGKLISYKLMAILLIVVAALGTWWYIADASKKANSQRWVDLDEANTATKLEELIKRDPNTIQARIAEIQLARADLGRGGLELFNSIRPGERPKGVADTEKAREEIGKWLEKSKSDSVLKNDPVFKAQCLWGLAMAEEGLVGVPKDQAAPTGLSPSAPATEFKGKVETLLGYLDQVAALQGTNPNIEIPWAKQAKERAEAIRKDPAKFQARAQKLFASMKTDPFDPPIAPKKN